MNHEFASGSGHEFAGAAGWLSSPAHGLESEPMANRNEAAIAPTPSRCAETAAIAINPPRLVLELALHIDVAEARS
jgi:hypothetical protein